MGLDVRPRSTLHVFIFDEIFDGCHKREVVDTPGGRPG